MQFNTFFSQAVSVITSPFIQSPAFAHSRSPMSFYLQLFFQDKIKKIKLQEWKFEIKVKGALVEKVLIQSQDEDDDSDEENLSVKNFFQQLNNARQQIQPKVFMKQNKVSNIAAEIKYSNQQIIPFDGRSTFHFQLSTLQTSSFNCFLSLKYNYEEEDPSLVSQLHQEQSQDQFQLLIDQSYENRKIQESKQQNRKWSQNVIIMTNDLSLSPVKPKINQKQEKIAKLRLMMAEIDWKTVRNKTLSKFMKEHSSCN